MFTLHNNFQLLVFFLSKPSPNPQQQRSYDHPDHGIPPGTPKSKPIRVRMPEMFSASDKEYLFSSHPPVSEPFDKDTWKPMNSIPLTAHPYLYDSTSGNKAPNNTPQPKNILPETNPGIPESELETIVTFADFFANRSGEIDFKLRRIGVG